MTKRPKCAAANGGGPSQLQSARLAAAVAELGSIGIGFMNASYLTSFLALLLLGGCSVKVTPDRPATVASAENFVKLLLEQLQTRPVEERDGGFGRGRAVHTKEITRFVDSFPPDRLCAIAGAALNKWGEYDKFTTSGKGCYDDSFNMHYGSRHSHAFIDVVAYPVGSQTRVDIFIRVLE